MAAQLLLQHWISTGRIVSTLKKILIVDDSQAEVVLMRSYLEQAGYWPVAVNDSSRIEQMIDSSARHSGL